MELDRDVDDAAGIDHVVRGVEHVAVRERLAVPRFEQQVVGGAGDDRRVQLGDRGVVQHRAEGTRREHVARHRQDLGFADRHETDLPGELLQTLLVAVGAVDRRAGVDEALRQRRADRAGALDRHLPALARVVAELPAERRADAEEDAVGGVRRRVAAAAVLALEARHVLRRAADDLEVLDRRVDVLGGDVLAAERVDEPAHRQVERLGLHLLRVAEDHRLATAEPGLRDRRLEGHAACQALHVEQRLLLGGIGPHAQAAQGGTQGGVVHGDDRVQTARRVDAAYDTLVAGDGEFGDLEGAGHGFRGGWARQKGRAG